MHQFGWPDGSQKEEVTFKICYRKRRVNQEGGGHLRKRGDPTLKETMTDKRYKKKQISTILKKKQKQDDKHYLQSQCLTFAFQCQSPFSKEN